MFDPRTLHTREVQHRVREAFGDLVFHSVINRTVRFPETTVAGEPITTWAPTSAGAVGISAAGPRGPRAVTLLDSEISGVSGVTAAGTESPPRFTVRLDNFTGPFDLLLQLIGKHEFDLTELALHRVTDDFIAHLSALGDDADLDETSEFLVVAATLLDLKAARLLPELEQPRTAPTTACSRPATCSSLGWLSTGPTSRSPDCSSSWRPPRCGASRGRSRWKIASPGCSPRCCSASTPTRFADLAAAVLRPKPPPTVDVDHLHAPAVSLTEHVAILRERLAALGEATFAALTADCAHPQEVIARFMGLLELFREATIALDQPECLGELTVRWSPPAPPSTGEDDVPDGQH